jgi:stage II sporulation protein D
LHLIVRDSGVGIPVSEHPLQDGDNIEYHLADDGTIDYLVLNANRRGASDERYSGVYVWETRVPRSELASRIRSRASIGDLIDIELGRRGVSGRLIEMTVIGTRGRFKFEGFSIERLLGLRETLFLLDRQYGHDGKVETFVFSGKGWGHGVGMCQVGAYGMALRGKTFNEILSHYYTDVTLERR